MEQKLLQHGAKGHITDMEKMWGFVKDYDQKYKDGMKKINNIFEE